MENIGSEGGELESISSDLLWEWWTAATQALADTLGTEKTLKSLRPYYLNANNAAAQISSSYFVELTKEPDFMPKMALFGSEAWFGGTARIQATGDLLILDICGCKTKGESKELCQMTCKELMDNQAQNLNPGAFAILEKSLSKGDASCRILIGTKNGMIERDSRQLIEVEHAKISDPEFRSFQIQYLSESWVFTTRAAIDSLGPQTAREKLCAYMRRSGLSYGIKLLRMFEGRSKEAILQEAVLFINDLHLRKGKTRSYDATLEEEVHACPFSQAPQEVCLQYEAFFNGICDAIDPNYEFGYHRMMTDGDDTCLWTMGQKVKASNERSKEDETIKILKRRLAEGEITVEQYHQLRDIVNEG